jgi:hypothetical protein
VRSKPHTFGIIQFLFAWGMCAFWTIPCEIEMGGPTVPDGLILAESGVTRPGSAVMLRFREIGGRFPAWSAAPVHPCAVGTCRPGNLQVLS